MIKLDKTKITKSFASGDVLAPFLDIAIEKYGDEPWEFRYTAKEHDSAWHPSGHCVPVASELYDMVTTHVPRQVSGSLQKSFMVGHFWHQWLQLLIEKKLGFASHDAIERVGQKVWVVVEGEPILAIDEQPMPYWWVRGSGDIAPLITPRWRGVVDIKTMSSHQFKAGSLPDWAADKYLCQLNIYMDLFDEEQGMILAANKDAPHDFREFHYVRNQELINAIYRKWWFVAKCIADNHRPTEKEDEEYDLPKQR